VGQLGEASVAGTVAAIIGGILFTDLVLRSFGVRVILPLFERKPPFGGIPQGPDEQGELISFPTTNGLTLRGRIHRQLEQPPRGVIVFCPEMQGDSTSAFFYCEGLWLAGFDILAFDFRNQGASESLPGYEPLHWLTEHEAEDALAAVRFARTCAEWADVPVGIFGISRGGGAALAAAARDAGIQSVAVEGAFTANQLMEHYSLRWASLFIPQWFMNLFPLWHLRGTLAIVRWISQYRRGCKYVILEKSLSRLKKTRVLQIHGERDSYVPQETALQLARCLPADHEFWLVPQASHNKAREVDAEEYDRRVVEFFEQMHNRELSSPDESAEPQPV
jgi:pimeloyl-ACP methyl ester carboxylesterase